MFKSKGVLTLLRENEIDLKYAKVQSYEKWLNAINKDPLYIKHIGVAEINLSQEQINSLCLIAVRQRPWTISYVKDQTPRLCIEAVKDWGSSLQYIREQTNKICLRAVKDYGLALQYVKKQTTEICIEAVMENGLALKFVDWDRFSKEQIDKICREALKQDKLAIRYIKDKEYYLKEFDIKYLEEQGKASEVIAVKEHGEWLFTVGCQEDITKEEFIHRIYNTGGGFDLEKGINVHRQVYINFLEQF
ncbi:TPA: DUF4116 domain-containing protein [Clostridioides difficile]|uniref:DUF4116 domain-containing protein n=1 Tax=Clostridioides difficile TaxID=1496 RepID=A0AAN5VQM8_CLODI|nr:DUF4116 domain-containing protein [Clostridioides difficile]EGT3944776.1 DUF4116 domain-containing protein [Clostridioides difficile]MBG0197893.1 DUF4116 domain-containing protein [Clostridioides difficile]MCA0574418.1 DUF4116 domain-containing protein [Clostridioides difficile]MDW0077012.1 DUF4116 domain-containing protein [Clostridioides difficile]PBG23762.1 hypothetical protein BGU81_18760 [Clostridioides difficile]